MEEEEEEEEEGEEEGDGDEEGRAKTPKEEEPPERGQVVEGFYKGDTDNFWLMLVGSYITCSTLNSLFCTH